MSARSDVIGELERATDRLVAALEGPDLDFEAAASALDARARLLELFSGLDLSQLPAPEAARLEVVLARDAEASRLIEAELATIRQQLHELGLGATAASAYQRSAGDRPPRR